MQTVCPRCRTHVQAQPGVWLTCPTCAFSAPVPAGDAPWRPVTGSPPGYSTATPAPYGVTHEAAQSPAPVSTGLAIGALLLNVLVIPGLGSLIGGRTQEGIWQLVLTLGAGIMLVVATLSIVGILLWPVLMLAPLAGWIWGLITGIQLVQRAS